MQKGFRKNLSSISITPIGAGGSHSYWKKRTAYTRIVRDVDVEAKREADLAKKRLTKAKIERLQMIKELAEL
jgi:hypothetical protein